MEGRRRHTPRSIPHKTHAAVSSFCSTRANSVLIVSLSVTSTLFTADARFVLSGSDDSNVRIWKAKASEKLGIINTRERAAIEYRDSLKEKWKFDPEVGKIQRYVSAYLAHVAVLISIPQDPSRTQASTQSGTA